MILRTAAFSLALLPLLALGNPIPTPAPQLDCKEGQDPCGTICCSESQYCPDAGAGMCMPKMDFNGVAITSLWVETISTQYVVTRTKVWEDAQGTAQATYNPSSYNPSSYYPGSTGVYNPPLKPTETDDEGVKITGGIIYPFPTGTGNGTTDFGGVIGGNTSSGGGLTGGQIGGIVAGVLVTFFLIALICFCCCLRKGFKGLGGWMSSGWKDNGSSHHGDGGGHSGLKAGLGLAAAGALLGKMFGGKKESTAYTATSYDASTEHSGGGMKKKSMLAASLGALAGGWWAKRKYDNHKTTTESSGYYTHSSSYDSRSSSDVSSSSGSSSSSSSSSSSGGRR